MAGMLRVIINVIFLYKSAFLKKVFRINSTESKPCWIKFEFAEYNLNFADQNVNLTE